MNIEVVLKLLRFGFKLRQAKTNRSLVKDCNKNTIVILVILVDEFV